MWETLAQPQVLASVVAAATSIVAATMSYLFTRNKATADARLEYEYEARKRLYEECQPLVFQIVEASSEVWGRLSSMASRISEGHLDPSAATWMNDGYYMRSTIYRIFRLLALGRLLKSKLTLFDATLDDNICDKFIVANVLEDIFCDHFILAELDPRISYDPYAKVKGPRGPSTRFQGLYRGEVQSLTDCLIIDESKNKIMRWHEFEEALSQPKSQAATRYPPLRKLFLNFHPDAAPVLWRELLAFAVLSRMQFEFPDTPIRLERLGELARELARELDYHPQGKHSGSPVTHDQIDAPLAYIRKRIVAERKTFARVNPVEPRVT